MQISDILAQSGGLQAMARELGISETDAARGASALSADRGECDRHRVRRRPAPVREH